MTARLETATPATAAATARAAIQAMAGGSLAEVERFVASGAHNREALAEPPACRVAGPSGFWATAQWLRAAYSDLSLDVHDVVVEGDLVAVHCTMRGRHTGDFAIYTSDGDVAEAFPPTGKSFAVTHTHWLRMSGGRVVEHWANRDDIGQAKQLGWVPPSPLFLVRMALAKRRARRALRRSSGV